MTLPTIHLNGTSRQDLFDGYCAAIDALHDAGRKLAATSPNGRDYYPQGDKAFFAAADEHTARMEKLSQIIDELQTIAEEI